MSFARPVGLYMGVTAKGARLVAACEESPTTPAGVLGSPGASPVVLVIGGRVAHTDVPGLCERLRVLLEGSDADVAVCDVGALTDPDAGTLEVLARLALTARRLGRRLRLRHASWELQEILTFAGLGDVLPGARG